MSATMSRPLAGRKLTLADLKISKPPPPAVVVEPKPTPTRVVVKPETQNHIPLVADLPTAECKTKKPPKPTEGELITMRVAALASARALLPDVFDPDAPKPLPHDITQILKDAGIEPRPIQIMLEWWTAMAAYKAIKRKRKRSEHQRERQQWRWEGLAAANDPNSPSNRLIGQL